MGETQNVFHKAKPIAAFSLLSYLISFPCAGRKFLRDPPTTNTHSVIFLLL